MQDPRAGALGVCGAFVLLGTKWTALAAITARRGVWILLAAVAARWAVAMLLVFAPAADPGDGLGARMQRELSARDGVVPTLTVALLLLTGNAVTVVACLVAAAVAATAVAAALRGRTGRLNGDVYGAAVEACETLIMLIGAVVTS
jgi:cobalamin synthase